MHDIAIAAKSQGMARIKNRVAMFDNCWEDQLDAELRAQFIPETYEQVSKMLDTSMNIFRRIVREICTVYREPASRKVGGENATNDKIAAVYKSLRVDQTMQVAHRYAKAATCSFIHVRKTDEAKQATLRVLTPDQVYVEEDEDDPTEMRTWAYFTVIKNKAGDNQGIWVVYTEDERWYADNTGKVLVLDPRTEQVYDYTNPYGVIPAVAFPAEFQVRDFWNLDWNKDAAEANLRIGLLWTYVNYLVKTQSFKQIVINADKVDNNLKKQILDPLFPINLSGNATATTLDLNTQIQQIYGVITGKVAAIANNYGISQENFSLTTQAASGFSLKIANQSLQDIREADIPLAESVEKKLYKLIAIITGELPEDADISFNPGEVAWPEEWTTEKDRWIFEFDNGLSSPVDYLISKDPQMSRADAIIYIQLRQQEIKSLKPNVSPWSILGDALNGVPGAGVGDKTVAPAVSGIAAVAPVSLATPAADSAAEEAKPAEAPAS